MVIGAILCKLPSLHLCLPLVWPCCPLDKHFNHFWDFEGPFWPILVLQPWDCFEVKFMFAAAFPLHFCFLCLVKCKAVKADANICNKFIGLQRPWHSSTRHLMFIATQEATPCEKAILQTNVTIQKKHQNVEATKVLVRVPNLYYTIQLGNLTTKVQAGSW